MISWSPGPIPTTFQVASSFFFFSFYFFFGSQTKHQESKHKEKIHLEIGKNLLQTHGCHRKKRSKPKKLEHLSVAMFLNFDFNVPVDFHMDIKLPHKQKDIGQHSKH